MSFATRPETHAPSEANPAEPLEASVFGRMPVLLGEREYGAAGAHATCFAFAVATWCFLVGGYAAQLVGAVQGTVCLLAGSMIGVFLAGMPLSLGCSHAEAPRARSHPASGRLLSIGKLFL